MSPVFPVRPLSPVWPGWPVSPVYPVRPVSPVCPVPPVCPTCPCGPAGPGTGAAGELLHPAIISTSKSVPISRDVFTLILLCVARRRTLPPQEIVRSKGSIQWRSGGRCSNVHTCTKSRYYLALALSAAWREKLWSIEDQIRFYSQGEPTENVLYIQKGGIKLSVVNDVGKEAIVAMLGPGDFFGEGGMAGQPVRMGMAIVIVP